MLGSLRTDDKPKPVSERFDPAGIGNLGFVYNNTADFRVAR